MCQKRPPSTPLSAMPTPILALADQPKTHGSRRRRLWELSDHAHCPIVGVCMPLPALRRLVNKLLGGQALAGDYELHCGVIGSTKSRTPLAEALNKELDRRYRLQVMQTLKIKDDVALAAWWRHASAHGGDLAGALWATLSCGRCTPELEHDVLGEVHMLQHQVGMACRASLTQMAALMDENAVLTRELGKAQHRSSQMAQAQADKLQHLDGELVRLRGELIRSDTDRGRVQDQLAALEAAAPELRTRYELTQAHHQQAERLAQLQRQLLQAQQDAERRQRLLDEATRQIAHQHSLLQSQNPNQTPTPPPTDDMDPTALSDRAVLCVGGRTAVTPIYRQLIERTGGRFLHHDGGEQDSTARLDSTLAAADLVICQTGCISHDAYWRVKNHCKRTGKRCVFVDTPSKAALERALDELCCTNAAPSDQEGLAFDPATGRMTTTPQKTGAQHG